MWTGSDHLWTATVFGSGSALWSIMVMLYSNTLWMSVGNIWTLSTE